MKPLGVRISAKALRLMMSLRGITHQTDLADMAGISYRTLIAQLNNERGFRSESLERLATALNCNPLDLLEIDGYPPPLFWEPRHPEILELLRT
ncbi:MAG: hypothetical protein Kow0047_32480 [Anaerolineae bacterium]